MEKSNWEDTRDNFEKSLHELSKKMDDLGVIDTLQSLDCAERYLIVLERLYLLYSDERKENGN